MSAAPFLSVDRLTTRLDGGEVLRNVCFKLRSGAHLAVVGPNGAGKSTLLRALLGVVPSTGNLHAAGRDLALLSARERARIMAYLPQESAPAFPHRVADFVLLARAVHRSGLQPYAEEDHRAASAALERCEVSHLASRTLFALSGGERQRVLLAAAIAQATPLLLLDEPDSHLDAPHRRMLHSVLSHAVQSEGRTVIRVTHDLSSAATNADTVLALRNGEVAYFGGSAGFVERASEIMQEPLHIVRLAQEAGVLICPKL